MAITLIGVVFGLACTIGTFAFGEPTAIEAFVVYVLAGNLATATQCALSYKSITLHQTGSAS